MKKVITQGEPEALTLKNLNPFMPSQLPFSAIISIYDTFENNSQNKPNIYKIYEGKLLVGLGARFLLRIFLENALVKKIQPKYSEHIRC